MYGDNPLSLDYKVSVASRTTSSGSRDEGVGESNVVFWMPPSLNVQAKRVFKLALNIWTLSSLECGPCPMLTAH